MLRRANLEVKPMAKPRRIARALADEIGLTKPKAAKRRAPAKKRVPARSFRARGD